MFFTFAFLLPVIYLAIMPAVTLRRLHDTGRSARWLLRWLLLFHYASGMGIIAGIATLVGFSGDEWAALGFGLFAGGIWFLVGLVGMVVMTYFLTLPGTTGPNDYGADPLRPDVGSPDERTFEAGIAVASQSPGDKRNESITGEVGQVYCTQCGTPLQRDARYCINCGAGV